MCVWEGRGTRFTARSCCCCWWCWESDSEGSNLGESECVRTPLGIQDIHFEAGHLGTSWYPVHLLVSRTSFSKQDISWYPGCLLVSSISKGDTGSEAAVVKPFHKQPGAFHKEGRVGEIAGPHWGPPFLAPECKTRIYTSWIKSK